MNKMLDAKVVNENSHERHVHESEHNVEFIEI